jgi:hypothetical protein
MLDKKQLAIFAVPRSGTKLLADIFQQQGYHNFGEFFNPHSVHVVHNQGMPFAKRLPIEDQILVNSRQGDSEELFFYKKSLVVRERLKQFKNIKNTQPSVVTVWFENCLRLPHLLTELDNRFFICLRRKNKFELLLSRMITLGNYNYNNEIPSNTIKVNLNKFESEFTKLCRVEIMQEFLINSNKGILVDFDELVNGTANLGFTYTVTSEDQHSGDELYNLIINLEEVQNKFKELELAYGTANTNHGFTGFW